jgi:TPR repeat protein
LRRAKERDMRRLRLAAAALLLAGTAYVPVGTAHAAEPDTAYAAYQTGHYRRALAEALKRIEADSSDAAAMTLVGELYRQGLGVPQDRTIATEWYERASARGDVNAHFALASALLAGPDAARNRDRAGELLRKAAAAGHPAANYNLALALLATGQEADLKRAVACLEIAARYGLGDAMHALATLARQGRGLPQSDAKAAEWMGKAAAAGQIAGEVEYAIMLFNGTGVAKDEAAAIRLFQRAAEKGNPIAQNRLARLYSAGRGVSRDSIQAASWHLAARAQGLDDDQLDRLYDSLTPEQQARAASLAASRIEGAALTSQAPASK